MSYKRLLRILNSVENFCFNPLFQFIVADDIIFGIDGDKISDHLETLSTLTPMKLSKKRDRRVICFLKFSRIFPVVVLIPQI